MEVRGGARAKGTPCMRWMENTRRDMNKRSLEERDVEEMTRWRWLVQNPDQASQLDNGEEDM